MGRGGTGRGWRRMGRGRTGRGAADGLPGAPHQLQVGHRPVRHQAVHLAPQRDGRQRVLEQPPGEQSRQLLHRFARGPCRGARSQVGRRGPARRPAAGSPRLPTLGPPPRAGTRGPAAPGLPWLPAPALRGSALPGPGARRRFTPKASDARSCLLRLIARDSPLPGKRARRRGLPARGDDDSASDAPARGGASLTSGARAAADWLREAARSRGACGCPPGTSFRCCRRCRRPSRPEANDCVMRRGHDTFAVSPEGF